MKLMVLTVACILLSGCTGPATQEMATAAFQVEDDAQLARQVLTEENKQACVDLFKKGMNDPSSFQLAGDFSITADTIKTARMFRPPSQNALSSYVSFWVPIRGKNAYGGLILKTMVCDYVMVRNPAPPGASVLIISDTHSF